MYFRIYFRKLGGHVHCRVFVAPSKVHTFAMAGELTFRDEEWPTVRDVLATFAELISSAEEPGS